MNDLETIKLTTPDGKEVELKSFVTARERNIIKSPFYSDVKIDSETGEVAQNLSGASFQESEEKLLSTLVISFDGSTENVLDRLLNGSPSEYDFVLKECGKALKGNLNQAK